MLVGIFVLMGSFLIHPERAWCPPGWYPMGVRPNGATVCLTDYPEEDKTPRPNRVGFPIRIYCNPAEPHRAIVVGQRGIKCK